MSKRSIFKHRHHKPQWDDKHGRHWRFDPPLVAQVTVGGEPVGEAHITSMQMDRKRTSRRYPHGQYTLGRTEIAVTPARHRYSVRYEKDVPVAVEAHEGDRFVMGISKDGCLMIPDDFVCTDFDGVLEELTLLHRGVFRRAS